MNGKLPQQQTYTNRDKIELEEKRIPNKRKPGETILEQYRVVASSPGVFRCNIGYTSTGPSDDFGPLVYYPAELIPYARDEIAKIKQQLLGAKKVEPVTRKDTTEEMPKPSGDGGW